ncbi:subtilisin-like protein [Sistotremastrum suecicum HHB10207 ss-3]|uniref:tripeptidyl-peptidase II n=1 Tax=Sistotremastrum suecicum HHB10207 ss-3 TaxID=1314776 RepID=A0A165ZET9_9AGAM|nr:subtilisin-like protein [Sistotremastrum suecicum HHB10207 ss-3]
MLWLSLLTAASALRFVVATPVAKFGDFAVKHAWAESPQGWELHSDAPADHILSLRIGLKQSRIEELKAHLLEVSDPFHSRYGQHLSKEEVEDFVKPRPESVELVESWLIAHGIDPESAITRSPAGDWLNLRVPVSLVEKMLDTKYNVFRHRESENLVVRTMSYSLPRELHDHVQVITPTTMFGGLRGMKKTSFLNPKPAPESLVEGTPFAGQAGQAVPTSCNNAVTTSCLQALYGTTNYVPTATANNSIGIAGYLEEFANAADLQTFLKKFRPAAAGATFPVVEINGGLNTQSDPGVEANLDIQTTVGLTFPTPNTYFSTGGSPPFIADSNTPTDTNEPYDQWVAFILAQTHIPGVISTSYGDDEQTVPLDFAESVCNSFAQVGARGTSLLFSSGDDGVGAGNCLTNDGTNKKLFQPNFPASCPFVTTVGGTTKVNPEVAVSFSGGGFSRVFAQPSYQASAVKTFLTALGKTNAGLFNTTGRAYPDVAAQGNNFQIVVGGSIESVGGTSASCPTVSSVIALLNDFRLSNGKSTLGFLNPLLYANPSALNDITSGSNPGCGTNGFTARAGWDPVTGLGSPNFAKLQTVALAAP